MSKNLTPPSRGKKAVNQEAWLIKVDLICHYRKSGWGAAFLLSAINSL
jgi:hypothetical protein